MYGVGSINRLNSLGFSGGVRGALGEESPILLDTVYYTGDGTSSRGIQLGARPSVVIALEYVDDNSINGSPLAWHDGLLDNQYYTYSFGANVATNSLFFQSMSDDGVFTVGSGHNGPTQTYRMTSFIAGADFETDTSGDITAEVNASVNKGFSHVTWTGTGVVGEAIPHGLGAAPELLWFKGMGGGNTVFPVDAMAATGNAGDSHYIQLSGKQNSNYIAPTSDFFYTDSNFNNSSGIAYNAWCFTSIAGLSDIGHYTGNGSSNGPTINVGFDPDMVFLGLVNDNGLPHYFDITDADGSGNITDSAQWHSAFGPHSQMTIQLVTNGFKITGTNTRINQSGSTYFYMALKKG